MQWSALQSTPEQPEKCEQSQTENTPLSLRIRTMFTNTAIQRSRPCLTPCDEPTALACRTYPIPQYNSCGSSETCG